jgi:hypothetical protein
MTVLDGGFRSLVRRPLAWVLFAVFILHAVGIGWGLPATDGWDDDGVAPRDFLVGLVRTFTPGDFYTYPPLHILLLALLTCPWWIVTLARAPSLSPPVLVNAFLNVPEMTAFAIVARVLAALMSVGIVFALAKVAEEIRGRRAALLVAAVVGLNAPFAYYAQTSNVDVPYCLWASLALLYATRAVTRHEPRALRPMGVMAAFAIATKDQAAALFVLGCPAVLAGWFLLDRWPRDNARRVLKEAALSALILVGTLAIVDGAFFNPSGFARRVAFLLGSASQNYASYPATLGGRFAVLRDSARDFVQFYPLPFAFLVLVGVARVAGSDRAERRAAGLIPLAWALSFTLLFNCLARRTDHRFLLPQMLLLGVYAGLGLDALLVLPTRWATAPMRALAAGLLAWALFECLAVDVALLHDTRYDAEAWLASHVATGDSIEVYGNQAYLPRLPQKASVFRIDSKPVDERNPLLGATEVLGTIDDLEQRRPQWIVVSDSLMWKYLVDPTAWERAGRTFTPEQQAAQREGNIFRRLLAGQCGYATAHVSQHTSRLWPRVNIHGVTLQTIYIFERAR